MKKWICLIAVLAIALCGCSQFSPGGPSAPIAADPTHTSVSAPVGDPTLSTLPSPGHSHLYLPEFTTEDVCLFYREVALDNEDVVDPSNEANHLVRKWTEPILYRIVGSPTAEDVQLVDAFTQTLSMIEGMPEFREAGDREIANHTIHFCSSQELMTYCPGTDESVNGYVTIWWDNDTLQIHNAEIYIRSDIPQQERLRVIQHEIYQSLGLVQDTIRAESIVYNSTLTANAPNDLDWVILWLHYAPEMELGMDSRQCTAVIEALYY